MIIIIIAIIKIIYIWESFKFIRLIKLIKRKYITSFTNITFIIKSLFFIKFKIDDLKEIIINELLKITFIDDEFYNRRNAWIFYSSFIKIIRKKDLLIT